MIVLIEEPTRVIQESPEEASSWNAVWHPIIYRFQRQDAQITDIQDIIGTGEGMTITVDEEITITAGSQIYIHYIGAGEPNMVLEGLYTVVGSTIGTGETDITIETDTEVVGSLGEGYINAVDDRSFYMIEIKILRYDISPAGSELTTSYAQFRPSNDAGDVKADLQSWLQLLVNSDNNFEYDVDNELDKGLGQAYTLEAREYWKEDGYGAWISDDLFGEGSKGVVNAVKQVGQKWGQNMGNYVMQQPQGSPQTNTFGKFLTGFTKPIYHEDYPYDISFIHSENIGSFAVIKLERRYDINGVQLSQNQTTLDTPLSEATSDIGVMRMMLDGGYASNVYRVDVSIYSDTIGIDNLISETKSIYVDHCERKRPEYFAWLNKHGGFDYWLFYNHQEITDTTFEEIQFERNIEDLEDANARAQTLRKRIQEQMFLGADQLTFEQIDGLKHILSSPKVFRYLGVEDDVHKWEVVTVIPGSFPIRKTSETKTSIAFSILPPERYNQQNG